MGRQVTSRVGRVDVPWSLVSFDGKVCLRDDKNAA